MSNIGVTDHKAEKPVELVGRLITESGCGLTLDPFMGSGTTLVAAKARNVRAIGIEIEERYCEMAAKRLQQSVFNWSDLMGTAMRDADEYVEHQLILKEQSE